MTLLINFREKTMFISVDRLKFDNTLRLHPYNFKKYDELCALC